MLFFVERFAVVDQYYLAKERPEQSENREKIASKTLHILKRCPRVQWNNQPHDKATRATRASKGGGGMLCSSSAVGWNCSVTSSTSLSCRFAASTTSRSCCSAAAPRCTS
eukprot:EG_transcript_22179